MCLYSNSWVLYFDSRAHFVLQFAQFAHSSFVVLQHSWKDKDFYDPNCLFLYLKSVELDFSIVHSMEVS